MKLALVSICAAFAIWTSWWQWFRNCWCLEEEVVQTGSMATKRVIWWHEPEKIKEMSSNIC